MERDRLIQVVATLLGVVMLVGAGFAVSQVRQQREELGLVVSMEGTEGMPPHVALATAALGSFRGLLVDVLWTRAEQLQDEGEYYEARTLARWITTLQPRFAKVWSFQAWNMAYNISTTSDDPGERWNWIGQGVALLRDRGIPLNPKSPSLYRELGFIFHDKIGGTNDASHWFYKAQLARDMQECLGDINRGRTTEQVIEQMSRIAASPTTMPELLQVDPDVQRVLDVLAKHGVQADESFLRMLGRYVMYTGSLDGQILGVTRGAVPEGTNVPLVNKLRGDRELATILFNRLTPFLQAKALRETYHMDPAYMVELMEQYGPLDWRHAHAHGIYWSEKGIAMTRSVINREKTNELHNFRDRQGMLQALTKTGRIEYDPITDKIDLLPDVRFLEAYDRGAREALARIMSPEGMYALNGQLAEPQDILWGHESYLTMATMYLYIYGDMEQAAQRYATVREHFRFTPDRDPSRYDVPLAQFVTQQIATEAEKGVANNRQFIDGLIHRGIADGLAQGDPIAFERYLTLAHDVWLRRHVDDSRLDFARFEGGRLGDFRELVRDSYQSLMKQATLSPLVRARIWHRTPAELRSMTWADLQPVLHQHAEAYGLDPALAFPAPDDAVSDGGATPSDANSR